MKLLQRAALVLTLLVSGWLLAPVSAQTQVWHWVNGVLHGPGIVLSGPVQLPDGTAAAPALAFTSAPSEGIYKISPTAIGFAFGGSLYASVEQAALRFSGSLDVGNAQDVFLSRGAANRMDLASGDSFEIIAGGLGVGVINTTAGTIQASSPQITVSAVTGVTVNNPGEFREVDYKVTIDRTAFVCAATTCDVTIATLPAKTQIVGVVADLTTVFACTGTCTSSTLSMIFGRGAAGAQWLASFDADAALAQFGDADAELGTTMTRAAAIQGGSFESWSSTQVAVLRLTSGTGNIGNGAATNLSTGSVTVYLTTRVRP